MPFSYAQYTGNGSTTTFSVPFPYLLKAHVKLYTGYNILDGTFATELAEGTDFTWTSDVQVQTTTAPASGVTLTVIRETPTQARLVDWQDGSNLISDDLDISDLQNLYSVQEQQDRNDASVQQSTEAVAAAAASAASTSAAEAAATAAAADAAIAAADAATALSQSTTALSDSATALTQSGTALTDSASALAAATSAASSASAAVTTATAADAKADSAIAAISTSAVFVPVANVAAIPASPADGDGIQVEDSTGIESFTPLANVPAGFVGDSGLVAKLRYSAAGATWEWLGYAPADPDSRYIQSSDIGSTVEAYDPNILRAGDIGSSVQPYDATILRSADIGSSVQPYDATILRSADIGSSVQAYDADTAKLDLAQTWTQPQTFNQPAVFPDSQTFPKVPQNSRTSAYILVAADAGKHISITTGGVTVPPNVLEVGDAVSIFNNSGSSQSLIQGAGVTLRLAGSSATGNRTIALYGLCTVLCVASNTFVVSGAGLS